MLTRSRLQRGEVKLEKINLEIGKRKGSKDLKMSNANEGEAPEKKVIGEEKY